MEKKDKVVEPLKILIINKAYYPKLGGVETVVKACAEYFGEKRFGVRVLTFNTKGTLKEEINDVHITRLPTILKGRSFRVSLSFKKTFVEKVKNIDVVLFNFPSGQPELYSDLYRRATAKKICFYHADVVNYGFVGWLYNNLFVKRFLKVMDKIIVTSPNIVNSSKILKKYKNKIKIIPLFVDISHFYPRNSNKKEYLLSLFNSNVKKIVMYIGRFARYKGLEYLVQAMKFLDNSYGLVLIGDGPRKKKLEKLIEKLDLGNRVVFLKHVSYKELPEYYSSADVFVLPSISRAEAFGLVALEAMACGVPVVTTELGTGTSYHNVHGRTGLVVPSKDSKSLAEAVKTICEENWKKKKEKLIINRAKEFSVERFQKSILKVIWE
ncbi:MAG: hypothetical protein PWQ20_991 [Thermotogaceae bacterium]|nr:hypothetical protein [Thermotogaceae bacterium]